MVACQRTKKHNIYYEYQKICCMNKNNLYIGTKKVGTSVYITKKQLNFNYLYPSN